MGMCIKEGSWNVLHDLYPEATGYQIFNRFGKSIRFYPPPPAAVPDPTHRFKANAIVFPRYSPESIPKIEPMPPYDVLTELVQANSIIASWDPMKIEGVSAWVCELEGFRITYPDLFSGMDLVSQITRDLAQRPKPR
jgi:hypothetical protein